MRILGKLIWMTRWCYIPILLGAFIIYNNSDRFFDGGGGKQMGGAIGLIILGLIAMPLSIVYYLIFGKNSEEKKGK